MYAPPPGFASKPFRLYLLLIVTWPVGTLYVSLSLPAGVPDLHYERILILLIVATVISSAAVWRVSLPPLGTVVASYAIVQTGWYFYHAAQGGIAEGGLSIFIAAVAVPVAAYWLTRIFITDPGRVRALLWALVAVGLLVAVTGFYERFIGAVESPFVSDTGTASGNRWLDVPGGRAAGVLLNPGIYGAVLGASVLATRSLYIGVREGWQRLLLAAAGATLLYGVFVSFTRSAWIATLLGGLTAYVVSSHFVRTVGRVVAMTVVVAVVFVAALGGTIEENEPLRERALDAENITGRIDRGSYSLELFSEKPLTGWGPGALDELIASEFAAEGEGFASSHNTFLTLLVDGGGIIFLVTLVVIARWLVVAKRIYDTSPPRSPIRYALSAMLGILVIFVVSGIAHELKYFGYFNAVVWIAGGVIESLPTVGRGNPSFLAPIGREASRRAN